MVEALPEADSKFVKNELINDGTCSIVSRWSILGHSIYINPSEFVNGKSEDYARSLNSMGASCLEVVEDILKARAALP